jgi:hypothetical protein
MDMQKALDAQPMGAYQPTTVDAEKAAADFRILDIDRKTAFIAWRDGRRERVSRWKLAELERMYTWAPDF